MATASAANQAEAAEDSSSSRRVVEPVEERALEVAAAVAACNSRARMRIVDRLPSASARIERMELSVVGEMRIGLGLLLVVVGLRRSELLANRLV